MASLGTSGTATFTGEPHSRVVVLDPDVLNRVDEPVTVTAEGEGAMWVGAARPSDAKAYLDGGAHAGVADVSARDWSMTTSTSGSGQPRDADRLDIWHSSRTGTGSVSTTIEQDGDPQSVVISAPRGETVDEVRLSVTRSAWGVAATALLVVGLIALLLGASLLLGIGRGWWAGHVPRRGAGPYVPRRAAPRRRATIGIRRPSRGGEAGA